MSNPHTKESALKHAEEISRVANERFGYRMALRIVLSKHGYSEAMITKIIDLAKERNFNELYDTLKILGEINNGS